MRIVSEPWRYKKAPRPHWVFAEQRGAAVLLSRGISILLRKAIQALFCISLFLFTCATPGLSQKTQPEGSSPPKYDPHAETKTKGVIDEVSLLSVGTRKDLTELIIKSGDKVHIYVGPKPFQEEMGICHRFKRKARRIEGAASDCIGKGA
jgi:hypothetical protein